MKRFPSVYAIILFIVIVGKAYSQTVTPPEFPGGKQAFSAFLNKNLKWPSDNMDDKYGIVIVGFFVEKDGKLTDIHIEKSMRVVFDKEALRVIKLSPKWIPAFKNNKPIKSSYTVPINFTLTTSNADSAKTYNEFIEADFPGGIEKFHDYIKSHSHWPANTGQKDGKVLVSFVIETNGLLSDIKLARGLSPDIDKEALRLVANSGKWNPSIQNGKPVRVAFAVPVFFKQNH